MSKIPVRRVGLAKRSHDPPSSSDSSPGSILADLPNLAEYGLEDTPSSGPVIPTRIEGSYHLDFNILEVHNVIMKKFANQVASIPQLEAERTRLEQSLAPSSKPMSQIERKAIKRNLHNLTQRIETIKAGTMREDYARDSHNLIQVYLSLGRLPRVISLKGSGDRRGGPDHDGIEETPESPPEDKQILRSMVISRYLEIARMYIDLDVIEELEVRHVCPGCGHDVVTDEGHDNIVCPRCGCEQDRPAYATGYHENDKSDSNSNYEDRENFYKALMRFQGKQVNKLPSDIYAKLDSYFEDLGLPSGDEIKRRPLNTYGRRSGTTREMLCSALSAIGYAHHYEDVNLVGSLYWGWKLPDIEHLVDSIMEDYDRSQQVYNRLKAGRKSSLNTEYRVYQHLRRYDFPCRKDDFKIIKTREILEYHETMWSLICSELGWTFHGVI